MATDALRVMIQHAIKYEQKKGKFPFRSIFTWQHDENCWSWIINIMS